MCCSWIYPYQPPLNPQRNPKNLPPWGYGLFNVCCFSLCLLDVQSAVVTGDKGPGEWNHTEPQIVLIQLPTLRLENSPWREGPEKWIGPLAMTFFPVHLPRTEGVCGPHSWALSPVSVPLVISYWPVFSKWTLIIYLLHGSLFDLLHAAKTGIQLSFKIFL